MSGCLLVWGSYWYRVLIGVGVLIGIRGAYWYGLLIGIGVLIGVGCLLV